MTSKTIPTTFVSPGMSTTRAMPTHEQIESLRYQISTLTLQSEELKLQVTTAEERVADAIQRAQIRYTEKLHANRHVERLEIALAREKRERQGSELIAMKTYYGLKVAIQELEEMVMKRQTANEAQREEYQVHIQQLQATNQAKQKEFSQLCNKNFHETTASAAQISELNNTIAKLTAALEEQATAKKALKAELESQIKQQFLAFHNTKMEEATQKHQALQAQHKDKEAELIRQCREENGKRMATEQELVSLNRELQWYKKRVQDDSVRNSVTNAHQAGKHAGLPLTPRKKDESNKRRRLDSVGNYSVTPPAALGGGSNSLLSRNSSIAFDNLPGRAPSNITKQHQMQQQLQFAEAADMLGASQQQMMMEARRLAESNIKRQMNDGATPAHQVSPFHNPSGQVNMQPVFQQLKANQPTLAPAVTHTGPQKLQGSNVLAAKGSSGTQSSITTPQKHLGATFFTPDNLKRLQNDTPYGPIDPSLLSLNMPLARSKVPNTITNTTNYNNTNSPLTKAPNTTATLASKPTNSTPTPPKARKVPCTNCHVNWWNDSCTGEPCTNCAGKLCMRAKCPNDAVGACSRGSRCNMVHGTDTQYSAAHLVDVEQMPKRKGKKVDAKVAPSLRSGGMRDRDAEGLDEE